MSKINFKMSKVCKLMIICGLLFCTSLQVQAEPSRPGRAEQQTESSGGALVLGIVAVAAAGGIVYLKKSGILDKKNKKIQTESQQAQTYAANQSAYDYSDLEATVAMEATVGWNQSVKHEAKFFVEVIKGVYEGRKYPLTGQRTMIGRAEEANIRFPADTRGVSRRHCQILKDENGLMILDLGSSWGTIIEGKGKIPENQPVVLSEGDKVHLGSEENTLIIRMEV